MLNKLRNSKWHGSNVKKLWHYVNQQSKYMLKVSKIVPESFSGTILLTLSIAFMPSFIAYKIYFCLMHFFHFSGSYMNVKISSAKKMITCQYIISEIQVKNFIIAWKNLVLFMRYFIFVFLSTSSFSKSLAAWRVWAHEREYHC